MIIFTCTLYSIYNNYTNCRSNLITKNKGRRQAGNRSRRDVFRESCEGGRKTREVGIRYTAVFLIHILSHAIISIILNEIVNESTIRNPRVSNTRIKNLRIRNTTVR